MPNQVNIQVAPATDANRDKLLAYMRRRRYPDSPFLTSQESKTLALSSFDEVFDLVMPSSDIFSLLATEGDDVVGFCLGEIKQKESITQEDQTVLINVVAESQAAFDALITASAAKATQSGDSYLVFHTLESQSLERRWASDLGMKTELLRMYQKIEPEYTFQEHPGYRLRRAKKHEILTIMQIVSQHSPSYIPAHRVIDKSQVQAAFIQAYSGLNTRDKKKVPLVYQKRSSGEIVGYVILQPTQPFGKSGPILVYFYDIAIGHKGKGLGLSRYMVGGAKKLIAHMGGGFLYGDCSPDNTLALSANFAVGNRIASRRWGLKLS